MLCFVLIVRLYALLVNVLCYSLVASYLLMLVVNVLSVSDY